MDSQEPQSPPPPPPPQQQQSPSRSQPLHLQPDVVLACLVPVANNTVPTTMMTPAAARVPPFNMNTTNPSPHSESFDKNTAVTVHSTTVQPCMNTVVGASSSAFAPLTGANKRKRGRPMKFVPQADPAAPAPAVVTSPDSSTVMKSRGRGRPRGSYKPKSVQVHGRAGSCFFPHVIRVNPGEDIIAKVTSSFRGGHESELCVLAANGSVSTVALHQSESIATFEGDFPIVTLSGSYEVFELRKGYKRMTDWKVQLIGPDSRIIGGLVAENKLIAASPVTVIMGSFTTRDPNANYWDYNPYVPPSQIAVSSEAPANANNQEQPASGPSSEDKSPNAIPQQIIFSDD